MLLILRLSEKNHYPIECICGKSRNDFSLRSGDGVEITENKFSEVSVLWESDSDQR
jgi:hypothetical protein